MKLYVYIVKRLILIVPVIIGVLTITFIISRIIPADPIGALLGEEVAMLPKEVVERIMHEYGLDKPLHEQYFKYMTDILRGNLGKSIRTTRPVLTDILTYFPATIELCISSIIVSLGVGIPLGIASAVRKDKPLDHFSRLFSTAGVGMPSFWFGLMLMLIFYYRLGWLPAIGRVNIHTVLPPRVTGLVILDSLITGNWPIFFESLRHLILPTISLAYPHTAIIARHTRSSMLEVMGTDYIRTARSKGLKERIVIERHALKNALIPTVTVSSLMLGSMLGGSVLIENVFSWPGLGHYATFAVIYVDFQAVMGTTLVFALTYTIVNLITDLIYGYLDPRIKY